jgi:flagellar biogenesis protein FliO
MDLAGQMAAVAGVFLLLGAVLWSFRRKNPAAFPLWRTAPAVARSLQAAGRLALTPQHSLHLVRMGDRALLVAVHAGGCTLIESAPWREMEACREEPAS